MTGLILGLGAALITIWWQDENDHNVIQTEMAEIDSKHSENTMFVSHGKRHQMNALLSFLYFIAVICIWNMFIPK